MIVCMCISIYTDWCWEKPRNIKTWWHLQLCLYMVTFAIVSFKCELFHELKSWKSNLILAKCYPFLRSRKIYVQYYIGNYIFFCLVGWLRVFCYFYSRFFLLLQEFFRKKNLRMFEIIINNKLIFPWVKILIVLKCLDISEIYFEIPAHFLKKSNFYRNSLT